MVRLQANIPKDTDCDWFTGTPPRHHPLKDPKPPSQKGDVLETQTT